MREHPDTMTLLSVDRRRQEAERERHELTLLAAQLSHRAKQAEHFRDQVLAIIRRRRRSEGGRCHQVAAIERIIRNEGERG